MFEFFKVVNLVVTKPVRDEERSPFYKVKVLHALHKVKVLHTSYKVKVLHALYKMIVLYTLYKVKVIYPLYKVKKNLHTLYKNWALRAQDAPCTSLSGRFAPMMYLVQA